MVVGIEVSKWILREQGRKMGLEIKFDSCEKLSCVCCALLTLLTQRRGWIASDYVSMLKKPKAFIEGMPIMKNLLLRATWMLQMSLPA